jgi:hypothetical protein
MIPQEQREAVERECSTRKMVTGTGSDVTGTAASATRAAAAAAYDAGR